MQNNLLNANVNKMSFLDLATMALHRRHEMEARINAFVGKCDQATLVIYKLKMQAKSLVEQLNCDPSELKERFLNGMKKLDEYILLITDFNLAVGKLEETTPLNVDFTPVHDTSSKAILQPTQTFNIMDTLSEPAPSTSSACFNHCPVQHQQQHRRKKVPREEQSLIFFSSASCSSESVPIVKTEVERKDISNSLSEDVKKISIKADSVHSQSPSISTSVIEPCNLPAQTLLQTEQVYPATIMNVDGPSLWIITDDVNATCQLMTDMTEYYKNCQMEMSSEDLGNATYCAFYDDENDCYCRALIIRSTESAECVSEVFLVDTGEVREVVASAPLRPLVARFAARPPAARCCHLAGIELSSHSKEVAERQEEFLRQYIGTHCSIEVDDNSSESLGVYVLLSETETLNELMVKNGLAWSGDKAVVTSTPVTSHGPPELVTSHGPPELVTSHGPPELSSEHSLDITQCEEYDDPLLAVTGHHYREEADICKHYKGGPEKTCFKGANCTKRHVLKHPDGWTLERTPVLARCATAALPPPATWRRAFVTYVGHYNRLCVQFLSDEQPETPLPLPEFGTVLPPRTLDELVRDMNSPATRIAYKPLKMMPAPGELVAALYPLDDRWYRARVVSYSRADQNVEVMYIDYGNLVWVREDMIRSLDARFAVLAAQAVPCVLAGVAASSDEPRAWTTAKTQLARLVQDRAVDLHVIARDYDVITVEMFDEQGRSIAEQLASHGVVKLHDYAIIPDNDVKQKLVIP